VGTGEGGGVGLERQSLHQTDTMNQNTANVVFITQCSLFFGWADFCSHNRAI